MGVSLRRRGSNHRENVLVRERFKPLQRWRLGH